jgi:hypothetical protein
MATASGANNPADPGSWNRYAYVGSGENLHVAAWNAVKVKKGL